jgi:ubiquinone/menaquinone biosynthesis C-methylase UbiE
MNKTEQSRKSYNRKAANYEATYDGKVTQPLKRMMLNIIEVRNGQTVVDVACGTGDLIAAVSKKADIQAHGIDIAEQMVKVAGETHRGISFKVAPSVPLPFDNASVDVIMVSAAFHHFEEPQRFADECVRVLHDGGKVYIGEFCIPSVARHVMNFAVKFLRSGDVRMYSDTELTAIFSRAGLDITDKRMEGSRTVLTCVKK